jgi:uncharacterized protein (TIGR02246 family)
MRALLAVLLISCGGHPATTTTTPAPTPTIKPMQSKPAGTHEPKPDPALKIPLAELQRRAIRAMVAAFNAHDAKQMASLYTADTVVRSPTKDGFEEEKGRDAIEKGHAQLFAASADIKIGTVRILQKGDVVVWEWIVNGTMKKPIGFEAASVLWFDEAGLIRVDHTYFDRQTIARQLGELKPAKHPRLIRPVPTEEKLVEPKPDAEAKNLDIAKANFAAYAKKDEKGFLATIDEKTLRDDLTNPEYVGGGVGANVVYFREMIAAGAAVTVDHAVAVGDFVAAETTTTSKKGTLHRLDVMDIRPTIMGWTVYGNRGEVK